MARKHAKSNNCPPRPPAWRAVHPANAPPAEYRAGWAAISWRRARADLERGLALEFTVEPSQATEFIGYARCRLHIPAGVRVIPKRQMVVLYPRPLRHVANGDRPPTRAILREDFRERLRVDAVIRTVVADAGTYLQSTPCGWDFHAALAAFIEEYGAGYGIDVPDVETLAGWCAAAEYLELLSPYWRRTADEVARREAVGVSA